MALSEGGVGDEEVRLLLRVARGVAVGSPAGDLAPALAAGLLRAIPASDVADLLRHQELTREAERLRESIGRTRSPRGLARLGLTLWPGARREANARAEGLLVQAEAAQSQAKEMWLGLSQRKLVGLDLALCAPCPDGDFLQLTDTGRAACRGFLYSEAFERECVSAEGLAERVRRLRAIREALLAASPFPDPRLDLAAALLSRSQTDPQRLREFDRLADTQRWQSLDRLPLLAGLCLLPGGVDEVWGRFWGLYDRLRADQDLPGSYETRYAALALLRSPCASPPDGARLMDIAKRLRRDGWALSQVTDPVATRLSDLRLSPSRVTTRVETLFRELQRGTATVGPFLGLAAALAAQSDLHPLGKSAESADLMAQSSQFAELVDRYEALLPGMPGEDSRRTVPAALLALMPGTVEGNRERFVATVRALAESMPAAVAATAALAVLDGAYPDWFDATRFVWELGLCLEGVDETSVFAAFSRLSPLYQGARAAVPDGSAASMAGGAR